MSGIEEKFQSSPTCHNGKIVVASESVASWEKAKKNLESTMQIPAFAYLTQQNQVVLGRWNGKEFIWPGSVTFDADYLIELSVFNAVKEWRVLLAPDGSLRIRILEDVGNGTALDSSKESHFVNQQYLLYGTIFNAIDDNWTSASEDRGGTMKLPFTLPFGIEKTKRVWCAVRNYFTISDPRVFSSIGNSSKQEWAPSDSIIFTDYRLCGFITEDEKGNRKEVS